MCNFAEDKGVKLLDMKALELEYRQCYWGFCVIWALKGAV